MRTSIVSAIIVSVALLLVLTQPSLAGTAAPALTTSFHKSGRQITATGTVGPGDPQGAGKRSTWRVKLQQRTQHHGHVRWRTRASGALVKRHGMTTYKLAWTAPPPQSKRRIKLRVVLVSHGHQIAKTKTKRLTILPPATVRSKLAPGAHRPPASKVESVTGDPHGTQTTILAAGVHLPKVGSALVVNTSPEAPHGLLGIVTSVKQLDDGSIEVTTKPATLDDAYKSFHARFDATLGELADSAGGSSASRRLRAAQALPGLTPKFECTKPKVERSITNKIDISGLHLIAFLDNGVSTTPRVGLTITGQPKLDLDVTFSGSAGCTAEAKKTLPIPSTPGLVLTIGPEFELGADGQVGAHLRWSPRLTYGFERTKGRPNSDVHVFKNGGSVNFSGAATLKASFAFGAELSLAKRVGVKGKIGPELTGKATAQTSPPSTCLTVDGDFAASLTAFADAFFKHWDFELGSWVFGRRKLFPPGGCAQNGGGDAAVSVFVFGVQTCALLQGGNAKCWGNNASGPLGYGDREDRHAPPRAALALGSGLHALQLAGSLNHMCGVLTGGRVKCWGLNQYGQLGYPDRADRLAPPKEPVNVGAGRRARQIATGEIHTCAVLDNGSVKCWGLNVYGQLGYGDTTARYAPPKATVNLGAGRTARKLVAGERYTCALLDNGSIKCWGSNDHGQLGYGDTNPRSAPPDAPVDLGVGRTALDLAAKGEHTCAVLDDRTVKCWGRNFYGQLGYGDTEERHAPPNEHIALGPSSLRQLAAGYYHTCAVLENGNVKCWGLNQYGQLGYGDETDRHAPPTAPISLGQGRVALSIDAGAGHTCALLHDHSLKCWGFNRDGELGYGDYGDETQRDAPPAETINLAGGSAR